MTVGATRADVGELRLLVTVPAFHESVLTLERKAGRPVVEGGDVVVGKPVLRTMAQAAIQFHVAMGIPGTGRCRRFLGRRRLDQQPQQRGADCEATGCEDLHD
jgi:hypothetical protein